jgi:serine/threonine protein phosphatase PrpC
VRSARLLGRDQPELGAIAAIAEGRAAITLSRGGARKTYHHTDPNEDAVCFALGDGGMLAAVADGHQGAHGSELAITWLLEHRARAWTERSSAEVDRDGWCRAARGLLAEVHAQIAAQGREQPLGTAPTTLSLALVRPAEDLLLHASVGDSHAFVVSARDAEPARDVGWASTGRSHTFFLGEDFQFGPPESDRCVIGCESLRNVEAVVLASDGVSERNIGFDDPAAAVGESVASAAALEPDLRPLAAGRCLTEAALAAHRSNQAGDNVAAAVLWIS